MSNALPPNLANAVAGQYQINIKEMFAEAWQKVQGIKLSFWGAFGWLFLIVLGLVVVISVMESVSTAYDFVAASVVINLFGNLVVSVAATLLSTTLVFLLIQHIVGKPVRARMIFEFHGMYSRLLMAALMVYVLKFFGGFALASGILSVQNVEFSFLIKGLIVLLAIVVMLMFAYVGIALRMLMFLIIEKKLTISSAISVSFKAIFRQIFKNIAFFIIVSLFTLFSAVVTLGIGLIWILPMVGNLNAIWYRQIFGVEANI